MTTRNSDIDLRPSEKGLLSVINFTVTKSGLEGKLLSIIINYEQPGCNNLINRIGITKIITIVERRLT
jgi:hypothetical protein